MNPILQNLQSILSTDPRQETFQGKQGPKDLLFTERVMAWIPQLEEEPSEDLLIAAWGHVVNRWEIPRKRYPEGKKGYHEYRYAQAKLSADVVGKMLAAEGFSEERLKKIKSIMMNRETSPFPEGQVLQDALCLAFLEMKLEDYVDEWLADGRMEGIFKGTWEKMSLKARTLALRLDYSDEFKEELKNWL